MSEKNFVAYGDAESILTGYANRIKQSPTTFVGTQAQWDALSSSQKAEYELVDITDDSLSPSGHVDWESFGELGAVNLFDFTINSTVAKGITFVQNSDGTVTVSGSNTQGSGVGILTKVQMLKKGTYILSGCPSITNGVLSLQLSDEPTLIGLIAEAKNGQEVTFTLASDTNVKIQYYANAIASITGSVTIKPMLRLATDSDSTYQPYAMTNKQITPYVQAISNPNLLDNPWFTVNQRGESSYSLEGYTVDRWRFSKKSGSTQALTYDGSTHTITIDETSGDTAYFQQRFETPLPAGTYTISMNVTALTGNASIQLYYEDGTFGNNISIKGIGIRVATVQVAKPITRLYFNIFQDASLSIKAVKLEVGSVSTLAMDTAPNYATELLKCQRYFYRMKPNSSSGALGIGYGWTIGTTACRACIMLPTKMRIAPTLTLNNLNQFVWIMNGATYNPVTCDVVLSDDMQNITIRETGLSGLTNNMPCILRGDIGGIIDLSADL
ncbi:MAG: hypothetical protein VZQ98_09860 [Bacteroidales bacterium]|nr:hypothetical protein [Bacteroidales bacterium]